MSLEVLTPTTALLDGRYVLEDRIGQGGMASVYRAEDTHLGRTVAIKMIHDRDGALGSVERAHTEKALLAGLNHSSLVTLFDAQLVPRRPQYLVMEFVDGPTLADLLTNGPIPPQQVARITRGLAEGLAAAHAAGIIHRDVKPSNILMARSTDRDGGHTAKLADFGIACSLTGSRMTSPGLVVGTLMYMAPEQLRDEDAGTAVDVFALGLVVLEALTGAPAYPSAGPGFQPLLTRLSRPPTIPESIDDRRRDLLERMLRLEPAERPSAAEVARAARDLGGTGEMNAVPPMPTMPAAAVPRDGTDTRTAPTAVMTPVTTSRTRRRLMLGAASLAAAAALVAGATILTPAAGDVGRNALATSLRGPSEPADTAPDATDGEPSAPVRTVDDQADEGDPSNEDRGNGSSGNKGKGDTEDQGNQDDGNRSKGNQEDRGNSGQSKGKDDD